MSREINYLRGIVKMKTEQRITNNNITNKKALLDKDELLNKFMEKSPIFAYIKEVTPTESRVLNASDNYIEMI
jgi:hypothetical protein